MYCNALGYNFKQLYPHQICNQNMIHKTKCPSALLVSKKQPYGGNYGNQLLLRCAYGLNYKKASHDVANAVRTEQFLIQIIYKTAGEYQYQHTK